MAYINGGGDPVRTLIHYFMERSGYGFTNITPTTFHWGEIDPGDTPTISNYVTGTNFQPDVYAGYINTITCTFDFGLVDLEIRDVNIRVSDLFSAMDAGEDAVYELFASHSWVWEGSDRADSFRGGDLNDTLHSGYGNDVLSGGDGADYLDGGPGSDRVVYIHSDTGLKANLGAPWQNTGEAVGDIYGLIENLTGSNFNDSLSGDGEANRMSGANGNDVLNGMAGNDVIFGNAGDDRIYGHLGNDTLEGNVGNDTFIFHKTLGPTNIDTITDFNAGQDRIELWNNVFTTLGSGPLAESAFKDMGLAPKDADDRIIYNSDTGILYYDADGSGTAFGNVKFAVLTDKPDITASDFTVV